MAWTLVFAAWLAHAQVPAYREDQVVAAANPHRVAIERAEEQFVAHRYAAAKATLEEEIRASNTAADQADTYNCLAWMALKTPPLDARQQDNRYKAAETYAAQAIAVERTNAQWWTDFASIRIRRAIDKHELPQLTATETLYGVDGAKVASFDEPGDRERLNYAIERALLLDSFVRQDYAIADTTKAIRHDFKYSEMVDRLLREHAETWSDWLNLWRLANDFTGGEEVFEDLTERPSGNVRAIEASALVRLHRGAVRDAQQRLLEARTASQLNDSAAPVEILLLATLGDIAAHNLEAVRRDYQHLRMAEPGIALALHASGIHSIVDDDHEKNARVCAQILWFARGLHLLGADEALRGLQRTAPRRQRDDIADDKFAFLQNEIDDMKRELHEFRDDARDRFERIEDDTGQLAVFVQRLDDRERHDFEQNQQLIREAQEQYARLSCRLTITEEHIGALAASVTVLRQRVRDNYQLLNQQLMRRRDELEGFKQQISFDVEALRKQAVENGERDQRFRTFARDKIVRLTAAVGEIEKMQAGDDVRNASDAVYDVAEMAIALFVPGMEALAVNAVDSSAHRLFKTIAEWGASH